MLKIRSFRHGFDEETYVKMYNAGFSDYDDNRSMTLEEMRKVEESPTFSDEGMFIAEWNGNPAGMINAYVDKSRPEAKGFIQSVSVLPEFRRRGIARQLVKEALESLKKRGMTQAETWAETDRAACVNLYESFGFKRTRVTSMMKRSLSDIPSESGKPTQFRIHEVDVGIDSQLVLLNRLMNDVFREHFNFRPKPIEETRYSLFEVPWFQNQRVFFAKGSSNPVGFVITGIDKGLNAEKRVRYGWILEIGVARSHRRMGIGARLMIRSMRVLRRAGMDTALLYVDNMNPTEAIRLYESLGFRVHRENAVYALALT